MNRLFYERMLERRVRKLERLIYERSVGPHGPSIAMNIWNFLMDHGPSTKEEIDAGLGARYSNNPALNSWVRAGLITKRGDRYIADPNYVWDDVGVISRPNAQDIQNALDADDIEDTPVEEPVAPARRGRTPRQPRQPRVAPVRQVKQNLFSRKFEEVKAAVEAGQDPTVANEKGKTPLMFACGDPKGQSGAIIEYLLEHGANANDCDGNRPVLFACCQRGDSRGIKALVAHGANIEVIWKRSYPFSIAVEEGNIYDDALVDLISRRLYNSSSLVNSLTTYNLQGKMSDAVYHAAIEKVVSLYADNSSEDHGIYSITFNNVLYELKNRKRYLLDLYIRHGVMPDGQFTGYYADELGSFGFNALYDAIVMAVNGNLKIINARDFLKNADLVCTKLNRDKSVITSFITPEYVRTAEMYSIIELTYFAVKSNNMDILNIIVSAKRKDLDYLDVIEIITGNYRYSRYTVSDAMTRQLCRILSNCLPKPREGVFGNWVADYIRRSNNRRFLEFMVDRGFGKVLCEDLTSSDIQHNVSKEFVDVMKENDIEIRALDQASDDEKRAYSDKRERGAAIKNILNAIKSDEWSRSLERYVTEHPDVLLEDDITEAIENNQESLTARQLQRRIDRMPKEVDKYDM